MISVENVVKFYEDYQALKNISFNIKKGEIVGLLGPNGAGKTTTMRIITGFIPATEGHVYIDGNEVYENPEMTKRLTGYMPENISLYTDMRVCDYLHFCAKLKHTEKKNIKNRIDEIVEKTALTEYRNRIIGHLSKGYRQRVGLAQSILHDPAVLILDEPTVGLDPNQIIEIRKLIKGLSGERTVILSTHILSEVEETCDRVLIINKGELIASDFIDNLKKTVDKEIGVSNIELKLTEKQNDALDFIRSIENVSAVEINKAGVIRIKTNKDIRSIISRKLVEKGFEILEMRSKEMTLEEVFLHFTKGKKTA